MATRSKRPLALFAGAVLATAVAVGGIAFAELSPTETTLALGPGETGRVITDITVPATPEVVDVCLLVDVGSTSTIDLATLRAQALSLTALAADADAQFGLASFAYLPASQGGADFDLLVSIGDPASFLAGVDSLSIAAPPSMGPSGYSSGTIPVVGSGSGHIDSVLLAATSGPSACGWRAAAGTSILIAATDADCGRPTPSGPSATEALIGQDIAFIGFDTGRTSGCPGNTAPPVVSTTPGGFSCSDGGEVVSGNLCVVETTTQVPGTYVPGTPATGGTPGVPGVAAVAAAPAIPAMPATCNGVPTTAPASACTGPGTYVAGTPAVLGVPAMPATCNGVPTTAPVSACTGPGTYVAGTVAVPGVPAMPATCNGVPTTAAVSSCTGPGTYVAGTPAVAAIPGTPAVPAVPEIPGIPAVPATCNGAPTTSGAAACTSSQVTTTTVPAQQSVPSTSTSCPVGFVPTGDGLCSAPASTHIASIANATGGFVTPLDGGGQVVVDFVLSTVMPTTYDITPVAREGCDLLEIVFDPATATGLSAGDTVQFIELITYLGPAGASPFDCIVSFGVAGTQTLHINPRPATAPAPPQVPMPTLPPPPTVDTISTPPIATVPDGMFTPVAVPPLPPILEPPGPTLIDPPPPAPVPPAVFATSTPAPTAVFATSTPVPTAVFATSTPTPSPTPDRVPPTATPTQLPTVAPTATPAAAVVPTATPREPELPALQVVPPGGVNVGADCPGEVEATVDGTPAEVLEAGSVLQVSSPQVSTVGEIEVEVFCDSVSQGVSQVLIGQTSLGDDGTGAVAATAMALSVLSGFAIVAGRSLRRHEQHPASSS